MRSEVRLNAWARRCLHRHAMPEAARGRLLAALSRELEPAAAPRPARSSRWKLAPLGWGFAAGMLVGALSLSARLDLASSDSLGREAIASHARSLQANHLSDIAAADGDAVRAWFTGKLDYAPRVGDMSAQGYALVGGRLDYVGGRAVAALVYKDATHLVNVFACPLGDRPPGERTVSRSGFNALGWSDGAMQYWVVADADDGDLQRFAHGWRDARRD